MPVLFLEASLVEWQTAVNEFLEAIRDAPMSASREEIFSRLGPASRRMISLHAHELDHLRRVHGTTFGLLYRLISDRIVGHSQMILKEVVAAQEELTIPFCSNRKVTKLLQGRYIVPAALIEIDSLTGSDKLAFMSLAASKALAALRCGRSNWNTYLLSEYFLAVQKALSVKQPPALAQRVAAIGR